MQTHDNPELRPDPDLLLAQANEEAATSRRGKMKIFFGMSAGVGKTYAMLEEARKRAAEGADVVVGYAEPHIRPDTEAILVGLDILPYRIIEYRGAKLKEFDLDAALARKPAICCVDEIAHSNAHGMRHPKRWQDVVELLDAGINVYTTLNVQHLESVNDLVERIAGVRVRETLPDAIFDAADDVELVDIAPGELLERFREGKIYRPEQAERASRHFFTKGNLIALRELALRKTADRVDEQIQQHRREERLPRIVPAAEKVLVCVGPSPLSARLVRSARRLSSSLHAKLIAVSVEPEGVTGRSVFDQTQIAANLKLAEELGGQIVTLTGHNVATEILAYAATHNVTKIVVGKPARPRWKDMLFGSVVDDLIRQSGEIDIYVIRGPVEANEQHPGPSTIAPAGRGDWAGYAMAVGVVLLTTALGWPLNHRLNIANANVLMLYLMAVLWVAARRSRGAAILTSVLAVLAFDIVFVPPFYTLAVADRQYLLTFAVMLLTALVISALTHRVRNQTEAARRRERRTAALLGLSRELASSRTTDQIALATQQHVSQVVNGSVVLLVADQNQKLAPANLSSSIALDEKEMSVAQWALEHNQPAGGGTDTLPAAAGTYVPLRGPRGVHGVLGVLNTHDAPLIGERRQMVEAFAAQTALAVERAHLAGEAQAAWERVEEEFLRNTLLSGVSHELRTPLAAITGAATALTEAGAISETSRREMLDTLVSESRRMERLINNLLDMTRMESGGLSLRKEWTPIEEIIGAALHHLDSRLGGRPVHTHLPKGLPLVHLDVTAIEQVLVNLVDNAVEYTPPGTPIDITVRYHDQQITVEVVDGGPGLPTGAEKRVFDKFFRAPLHDGSPNRGVGLGLAICRGIIQAHEGQISATNRIPRGAAFTFTLPVGGVPPAVDASD